MRLLSYLLFCSLFWGIATSSNAQRTIWKTQNPPSIAGNLNAVQMISASTTYIVGDKTTFMRLTDSGRAWVVHINATPVKNKASYPFTALSFIDSLRGMVVGTGQALKTTDAGETWTAMTIPGASSQYGGVLMVDSSIAFIVANSSSIFKTTDGGSTWKEYTFELGAGKFTGIKKVTNKFLVITADPGVNSGSGGSLVLSTDSGAVWFKAKTNFGNGVNAVAFENEDTAIAVESGGQIIRTSDQGSSWSQPYLWDSSFGVTANLNAVDSKAPGHYVVVGGYNTLLYTFDDGKTWNQGALSDWPSTGINFGGVAMWDDKFGVAVGSSGVIIRTNDGGQSWQYLPDFPLFNDLYSIAFPKNDTSHGIAVGAGGAIVLTSDGGKHWTNGKTGILEKNTHSFNAIAFRDATHAITIGDNGIAFSTSDFGTTWSPITLPVTQSMRSIYFSSAMTGWIVGDSAYALKTTDGGTTWQKKTVVADNPYAQGYLGVTFCDDKNGIIIGNTLPSMITTDGGDHWAEMNPNGIGQIYGYAGVMLSPTHWTISAPGVFYTHIGAVLDSIPSGDVHKDGYHFLSVAYADSLNGIVVGNTGLIYHTFTGGRDWVQDVSNTSNTFLSVCMPTPQYAWASGSRGVIDFGFTKFPADGVDNPNPATVSAVNITGIYPNPVATETTIRFTAEKESSVILSIHTVEGIELYSEKMLLIPGEPHEKHLQLSSLSSGEYIVHIASAAGSCSAHLMVSH